MLTIKRVPFSSPSSAPGRSCAVAQYVHTRKPAFSSRRRASITGAPPISMRGWQTMPTASAMSPQVEQEFAIPLGAQNRRGHLRRNLVPRGLREFPQFDEDLAVLVRVAHDPALPHRALAALELRLDQRDHVARRAEELADTRQYEP